MPNFEAHVEANMADEQTAYDLSQDNDFLEAQWGEARQQATDAGKTPNGNPVFTGYTKKREDGNGMFFDFVFRVPVA